MLEIRRFIYDVLTLLGLCSVAHWKPDVLPLETYPQSRQYQVLRHFLRTIIGFFEIRKGLQHQNRQMFFDKWYETASVFKTYEFPKTPSSSVNYLIKFFRIGELKDVIDPNDNHRCIWAGRSICGWQEYRANVRLLNSMTTLKKLVMEKKSDMKKVFQILLDLQKLDSKQFDKHWEKLRYSTQSCWILCILLSPYDLIKQFERENFLQVPSWNVNKRPRDFMCIQKGSERVWCSSSYESPIHVNYYKYKYEQWLKKGSVSAVMLLELFVFFYHVAQTLNTEDFAQTLALYVHRYEKAAQYMEKERHSKTAETRRNITERDALWYQHYTDCNFFTAKELQQASKNKFDVFGFYPTLRGRIEKLELELENPGVNTRLIIDQMKERRSEIVKELHDYWKKEQVGDMRLDQAIRKSVGKRWRGNH